MKPPPFAFLTNHGLVLLCIAEDRRVRVRDIAQTVDITERAAQRIVADLVDAGYVTRKRDGRRNTYAIRSHLPVTLPRRPDVNLKSLLHVLLPDDDAGGDAGAEIKAARSARVAAG